MGCAGCSRRKAIIKKFVNRVFSSQQPPEAISILKKSSTTKTKT